MEGAREMVFLALLLLFSAASILEARKLSGPHAMAMDPPKEGAAATATEKPLPAKETPNGKIRLSITSQTYLCRACLELSKDAQEILSSPETGHIASEFLSEHICSHLSTPTQRRKCEELVDAYIPLILLRLQDHFAPDKLCTGDQVCGSIANFPSNYDILSAASDVLRQKKSESSPEISDVDQIHAKLPRGSNFFGIDFSEFNDVFMKHATEEVFINSKYQEALGVLVREGNLWEVLLQLFTSLKPIISNDGSSEKWQI